jgi:superfamily II DNA or RNA helicase
MAFEGEIRLISERGKVFFLLDAEPHVMQRLRKVFDTAKSRFEQGAYTHRPIAFPITLSACRDLLWLMSRYDFDCEPETLDLIKEKSEEHDRIVKSVSTADSDSTYRASADALPLALELRPHQVKFKNMFGLVRRMLLADKIGAGKTASALSVLVEPQARPAIIVVPSHLCTQWEREAKRFLPGIRTHVIRGFKNYPLPNVDVVITGYNRLSPWQDALLAKAPVFKTVIFDEAHELRHQGTAKRDLATSLSRRAQYVLGLSGTPIFNMGAEIWSVLDCIKPNCLGAFEDFESEWCSNGAVVEPSILNSYLKKHGLMLRRTDIEAGLTVQEPSKVVITIDADLEKLKEIEDVAKALALSVLSGNVGEESESARQFDFKLRHATGVSKARPVAEFVKLVLEQEEKVVIAGWHRDVYITLLRELARYKPVMYTGSESAKEKDKAIKDFIEGDARVFIISLRSGAGIDGLQRVCSTMVFAELDWSPHVTDQVVGRLAREGQARHVNAFYLTVADGSDPYMMSVIGTKRSQHDGLVEGKEGEAELLADAGLGRDRVRAMAASYLKSIGEAAPEAVREEGLLGDVAAVLRRLKVPVNTEAEMQKAVGQALRENLKEGDEVLPEFVVTKRSRLDFLVTRGVERIAIECKIEATKRPEVYRQVRRYVEEGKIGALVLLAPWFGIASFKVDGTPVVVVDTSASQI